MIEDAPSSQRQQLSFRSSSNIAVMHFHHDSPTMSLNFSGQRGLREVYTTSHNASAKDLASHDIDIDHKMDSMFQMLCSVYSVPRRLAMSGPSVCPTVSGMPSARSASSQHTDANRDYHGVSQGTIHIDRSNVSMHCSCSVSGAQL